MNRFLFLFVALWVVVCWNLVPAEGLNIGIEISPLTPCSNTCESKNCDTPFLRYGKYCGYKYNGCPGATPCDGLDACCLMHDECIYIKAQTWGKIAYLSESCNQALLNCTQSFKNIGAPTFPGSECSPMMVISEFTPFIQKGMLIGRFFHIL